MTRRLLLPLIAALLLVVPLQALADAGAFQFVVGEVKIVRADGSEMPAVKGAKLAEGDTVVTGPSGSAQILMSDQAMIALRPDSSLKFETYRFSGREDGSEKGILGLLKGGFRTLTGLIGRANRSNYQVRTPTATIGIRGTDHEPFYIPPSGWSGAPGGDPGTYNKVNSGATFIQTEGGSIELGPNQVGFAPADPRAIPTRLERIPNFMRAAPMMRGQGERRGPGDGPGRGERRGPPQGGGQPPPPPGGGQMPPPPPSGGGQLPPPGGLPPLPPGGLPPRSGDIPPFIEPLAAGGSFGFNQAVADLTPAPFGTAGVGGDRSHNSSGLFFGSGAGVAAPGDLEILLDTSGHLALVADQDGFRYARSGAPIVHTSGAAFMDGATQVNVKWGIYAGGAIVDGMGPRAVDFFHFMNAPGTPLAIAATLSGTYNIMLGHTPTVTELGVGSPTGLAGSIVLTGGNVTAYSISMANDGFGRSWSASCPGCTGGVPLAQFVQNGVSLAGTGPGGAATGNGHGVPIGPSGGGIISSYDLRTAVAGVTGSFVAKK